MGCIEDVQCVVDAHSSPAVDYVTAHIWPQNWSWADPKDLAGTWPTVERNTRAYIAQQVDIARRLGKPLVIEEFGMPREGGSFDPSATTTYKDRFYQLIYAAVLDSLRTGRAVARRQFLGVGRRRPRATSRPSFRARRHQSYLGDPPHEPQGWYSVFDSDASTQAIIRDYAAAAKALA